MEEKMLGAFLLQIILITLNAVFASAEIAVISLNETKLKQEAKNGDVRAERLMSLTKQPARFLVLCGTFKINNSNPR